MSNAARSLFDLPTVCDIVVSDFGRDATVEYMRLVSSREREVISSRLATDNLAFFDEYRRIMFTSVGDVNYLKRPLIEEVLAAEGSLTPDVLIGGGLTPVSNDFVERMAFCVAQEATAAHGRGHRLVRIAVPCNALSQVMYDVGALLQSGTQRSELRERHEATLAGIDVLADVEISVHTVPEAVLRTVARDSAPRPQLLLLGVEGTQEIYARLSGPYDVELIELGVNEQRVVNEAIVATIGGDPNEIGGYRDQLREEVIVPNSHRFPRLVVIEACTDFDLGLGISSLGVFANEMVRLCYG